MATDRSKWEQERREADALCDTTPTVRLEEWKADGPYTRDADVFVCTKCEAVVQKDAAFCPDEAAAVRRIHPSGACYGKSARIAIEALQASRTRETELSPEEEENLVAEFGFEALVRYYSPTDPRLTPLPEPPSGEEE